MRVLGGRLPLVLALAAILSAPLAAQLFVEDFSSMPDGSCVPDGSQLGVWSFVFDGFGCSGFVSVGANTVLVMSPMPSSEPWETHAGLVTGPETTSEVELTADVATLRQLRTGDAPNAWEAGWILWHYTDNARFYYFVPKPNGWELGKADPAYPGAQRFLATGSSPSFPTGAWYRVRVMQSSDTIRVYVNDLLITTFVDRERPYTSGRLGLYSEDAEVAFDNVAVSTAPRSAPRGKSKRPR